MTKLISEAFRVGVVGYSSGKFDLDQATLLVKMSLSYITYERSDVEIVSGLTNLGIPKLAYEWAAENDHITVGIACKKASDYETFPCDRVEIVGDNWGDESQTFIDYIDAMVRIGGGDQSMEEVKAFKKQKPDAQVIELELKRD